MQLPHRSSPPHATRLHRSPTPSAPANSSARCAATAASTADGGEANAAHTPSPVCLNTQLPCGLDRRTQHLVMGGEGRPHPVGIGLPPLLSSVCRHTANSCRGKVGRRPIPNGSARRFSLGCIVAIRRSGQVTSCTSINRGAAQCIHLTQRRLIASLYGNSVIQPGCCRCGHDRCAPGQKATEHSSCDGPEHRPAGGLPSGTIGFVTGDAARRRRDDVVDRCSAPAASADSPATRLEPARRERQRLSHTLPPRTRATTQGSARLTTQRDETLSSATDRCKKTDVGACMTSVAAQPR
jgi:hypothetical protein